MLGIREPPGVSTSIASGSTYLLTIDKYMEVDTMYPFYDAYLNIGWDWDDNSDQQVIWPLRFQIIYLSSQTMRPWNDYYDISQFEIFNTVESQKPGLRLPGSGTKVNDPRGVGDDSLSPLLYLRCTFLKHLPLLPDVSTSDMTSRVLSCARLDSSVRSRDQTRLAHMLQSYSACNN